MRSAGIRSRHERLSGPFYVGRASFRMGMVEGGVVSGQFIGEHTPAKGIGYLPIDPDEEWEVSPVRDEGDEAAASPASEPDVLFGEEEEPTTVFMQSDSSPVSRVNSRSVVAVFAVVGFVSGALVSTFGLKPRLPSGLIGRVAARLLPLSNPSELPAPLPTSAPPWPESTPPDSLAASSTSPELLCEGELFEPRATTTEVATAEVPGNSAVNVRYVSPKQGRKTQSPTGSTSAAGWVDPWAD